MKFKRLTLEKSRPVSCKRLEPKHKSGRVFQQSLLKSVTGSQDSITSKPPSESVSGSVTGSVSETVTETATGSKLAN